MKWLAATLITFAVGLACVISAGAYFSQGNASQTTTQTGASTTATNQEGLKGIRLVGKLTTKLDTKHSKSGQDVVVEVQKDVKAGDQVVLKKGSLIKGTLTEVTPYSKGSSNGELDLVLDSVFPKQGQTISTHLVIYALAAKQEQKPEDIYATKGYQGLANAASVSGQVEAPTASTLSPEATGIFGFQDVELHPLGKANPPTSTIVCKSGNIVLERETGLVMVFVGQ
jgi:hypothetical protein